MNSTHIAAVFYSVMGLLALWFVLSHWCAYTTEKLRQDIFQLRAELFDYAASGGVSFKNRSYRRLRLILNSMIRFAHEVSFVRVVLSIIVQKIRPVVQDTPNYSKELTKDTELSGEAREKLLSIHYRLMVLVLGKIMKSSLVAFPVSLVFALLSVLAHGLPKLEDLPRPVQQQLLSSRRVKQHIQLIEQQAIETRENKLALAANPVS